MKKCSFFLVVTFFSLALSTAFAETFTVTALNKRAGMLENYYVDDIWLELDGNTPTVVVRTEGDCETKYVYQCRSYSHEHDHHGHDNDHHGNGHHGNHHGRHHHDHCNYQPVTYCNHQTGRYPLPANQISFDGAKRWKFIEDGNYQTIARNNRKWYKVWLGRTWEFSKEVDFELANDYSSVTLRIKSLK